MGEDRGQIGWTVMLALACGCGESARSTPAVNSNQSTAGGMSSSQGGATSGQGAATVDGGSTRGGGSSATTGGSQSSGSGGASAPVQTPCEGADGEAQYGPLGEPYVLPADTVSGGDCTRCGTVRWADGFRSTSGYGFAWTIQVDSEAPMQNLFSMTVDSTFHGGPPHALPTEFGAAVNVFPMAGGFLVATCSVAGLARLDAELKETGASVIPVPAGASVTCPVQVFSTEAGLLTALSDDRGVHLALFDEAGTVLHEVPVSAAPVQGVTAHFSRNGDRILVVMPLDSSSFWYGVVDLQGNLLDEAGTFTDERLDGRTGLDITTQREGWVVAASYDTSQAAGFLVTGISQAGRLWKEQDLDVGRHPYLNGITESAYGGVLLVGWWDTGGQFSGTYAVTILIDDNLETVYHHDEELRDSLGPSPTVIDDPERDLVILTNAEGREHALAIQEYGCLD